jgi:hypothetical protein
MTTLRDISSTEDVCWRFHPADKDAPDHRPTFNHDGDDDDPSPSTWDSWEVESDYDDEEPSDFMKKHGNCEVELLEHWSTHPEPTPLRRSAAPVPVYRSKAVSDIGETLGQMFGKRIDGMGGDMCLYNFEMAQRKDLLSSDDNDQPVCRHPDHLMTFAQVSFAREIWEVKLRVLRDEAREKERTRVVCDDQSGE